MKGLGFFCLSLVLCVSIADAQPDLKRTPSGKPDLSGFYDTGTLTPLQRPEFLGETEYLYKWVAELINWAAEWAYDLAFETTSDPDREAPPEGGDGNNMAGAGGVGGYNAFYIDPGNHVTEVDGKIRTSIIYDPPNGRQPAMSQDAQERMAIRYKSFGHENTGTASWLDEEGDGPFDGPETLAPSERCLISFGATVPTIPSLYNNFKRIIQTEDYVMILQEMVHDARVIRINSEHLPEGNNKWLGDSIGYWDGDVLVVETRNFFEVNGLLGADENLLVVERFSRNENGDLDYDFTVEDETVWSESWSGRYTWKLSDSKVYEYACHEGNYSMGNILRGARLLEQEWEPPNSLASGAE